jgi:hypothetical protein
MARSTLAVVLSVVGLAFGCGQSNQTVKPSDMSAEAHRQEAQKAAAAADREQRKADTPVPPPNLATGGGNPEGYYYDRSVYDASNEHLARARELGEHARQHEAAAATLEKFEQAECKQFPAATRAACPLLGPVVSITDIPRGVTVRFADGTRADAVLAHMRCHLAFAQAHGFGPAASCPLYMKGIDIRAGSDPRTIDIVSANAKTARKVQALSREEAILVQGGSK